MIGKYYDPNSYTKASASSDLRSRVNSLLGRDTDSTDNTDKISGTNQAQNTDTSSSYSSRIQSLLGSDSSTASQSGTTGNRYNPYTDRSGNLNNKYIDYQSILDSNTSRQNKNWIKQATGLEESESETDTAETTDGETDTAETTDGESSTSGTLSNGQRKGYISAKYETGGWDPGLVSSGEGDYGGISYGIPQFSTTTGSAKEFVSWLKQTYPEMASAFGDSSPGTSEFGNAWKSTYEKYGDKFADAQVSYAYDHFVKPLAELAKEKTGIDYTSTDALYELIYSTAIQFGNGSTGLSALGDVNSGMSETDIINASYDKKINNVGSFFRSSSSAVQNSVKNRFKNERNDVLSLVK